MSNTDDMPQPVMVYPSLRQLPPVELPDGYRLQSFREGDEALWNDVLDASFGREPGTTNFATDMATDPAYRPERVKLILSAANEPVATASAWHRPAFGELYGYLHWVGTHPEHRGKRLGYWVSLAAMHQAAEDGREAMLLETSFGRVAAIKLYLNMGFEPRLTDSRHAENWRQVLADLNYPQRFETIVDGPLNPFCAD